MNIEQYTERMRGFVQSAQSKALSDGHQQFTVEHILKALLDDDQGMATSLISRAGADGSLALNNTEQAISKFPKVEGSQGQLYLSPDLAKISERAEKVAKESGDSYITVERFLLAIVIEKSTAAGKILAEAGLTAASLNKAIEEIRKGRTADSAAAEDTFEALSKYLRYCGFPVTRNIVP